MLLEERPDAVLVLGDTNSCLATVMAKRMRIPTYHMEAGNRCFDENVPEETNRRLVDHVADFNLAYTEHARRNLLAEGLHPRRVLVTGSPMREVLDHYRDADRRRPTCWRGSASRPGRYFLVSAHREENVDSPERLRGPAGVPGARAARSTTSRSSCPPTRARASGSRRSARPSTATCAGWSPSASSTTTSSSSNARCVLSDSGTISEESSILGFPAITLRDSIERPEALDAGSIMMTGLDPDDVVRAIAVVTAEQPGSMPEGYDVTDTSARVVRHLLSTASRHHAWAGIRT